MQYQTEKGFKKIKYILIKKISLSAKEFIDATSPIVQPYDTYMKYGLFSTMANDGSLRCIALVNDDNKERLIVYTGGQTRPLYASYTH